MNFTKSKSISFIILITVAIFLTRLNTGSAKSSEENLSEMEIIDVIDEVKKEFVAVNTNVWAAGGSWYDACIEYQKLIAKWFGP